MIFLITTVQIKHQRKEELRDYIDAKSDSYKLDI